MDNPIGRMYGNSHEIVECIQCLKGVDPADTMELVYAQAEALGYEIQASISDGSALKEFEEMCIRQNVDSEVVSQLVSEPWSVLDRAPVSTDIIAQNSGYISQINALTIGEVLCKLGEPEKTQTSTTELVQNYWLTLEMKSQQERPGLDLIPVKR